MASIRMKGLVKRYDDLTVIPPIDLEIRDQEFVVFVGPSGCGKSTLLRVIAGLETVDEGDLFIGETRVNDVAPARRDIAMVFQDYALYPHMTVYDNMAFALEMRRISRKEIDQRVQRAAGLLRIEAFLQRKPKALSGGQRQRVAMGRAMVRNPKVFLFDEPLSNLDAKLRGEVRTEIKALSQQLKTTMVFVTHDQVEAMTMADRIVVLKAGVVQQFGTPAEVYKRPANQFVASFIGSPTMNFFPVALADGGLLMDDGTSLALPAARMSSAVNCGAIGHSGHSGHSGNSGHSGDTGDTGHTGNTGRTGLVLGVRPEHLRVLAPGEDGIRALVTVVEPLGSDTLVYFDRDGVRHVARVPPELPVASGDTLNFGFDPDKSHLFDADSGEVMRPVPCDGQANVAAGVLP